MPKKYRIEMTLLVDASDGEELDGRVHKETYDSDAEAKEAFAKKARSAEDTAKGSSK